MPVVAVYDLENNKIAEMELSDKVFGAEVNDAAIYEVVKMQLAARRSGTAVTKGRSDVSGGGKKPWRQKGTGRARAGTTRSPLWRGGGTVFGPVQRSYAYKIPKKVRRLALRSALSQKCREEKIVVLQDFPMSEIKTKRVREVLDRFHLSKVLLVIDKPHPMLEKSSRNIQNVKTIRYEGLNVYDLIHHDHIVLLQQSVKNIEGVLQS
jgi:large subunit ribosomal protein L4